MSDEYTVSICAKDSSESYHYALRQHLVGLAKEGGIPFKLNIYPFYMGRMLPLQFGQALI